MIGIIISLWFVFLMAFFNAVMDATENEPNFNESILRTLNRKFWLKPVSCDHAYQLLGYKFDAWHIAKTCMVFCLVGVIIASFFAGMSGAISFVNWFGIVQVVAIVGAVWNGSFILFY